MKYRKQTVQLLAFTTVLTILGFVFFNGHLPVVYAGVTPTPTSPAQDTPTPPAQDTPTPPAQDTPTPPPGDTPTRPPGDTPVPTPTGTVPPQDIPELGNGTPFALVATIFLTFTFAFVLIVFLLVGRVKSFVNKRN